MTQNNYQDIDQDLYRRLAACADQQQLKVSDLLEKWLAIDSAYRIDTLVGLHRIVDEMPISLVVANPHHPEDPIEYANQVWRQHQADALNQIWYAQARSSGVPAVASADEMPMDGVASLRQAIATGTACNATVHHAYHDGTPAISEMVLRPIVTPHATRFLALQLDVLQREKALEAATQDQQAWQALFDNTVDGILIIDNDGCCVDVNPAGCQLFGVDREQLIGQIGESLLLFEPPLTYAIAWQTFLRSKTIMGERQIQRPDGTRLFVETRGSTNFITNRHVLIVRDVTTRKQVEAELQASEQRFRVISELTSDYAYSFKVLPDGSLQREWVSEGGFEKITGFTPAESEARGGWAALPVPEDMPLVLGALKRLMAGEKTIQTEFRARTKQGDIRYILAVNHGLMDETGKLAFIHGAGTDITMQKLALQSVAESEARYRLLADNVLDVIVAVDHDLRFVFISPSVERLLGYQPSDLLGYPVIDLGHPDDYADFIARIQRVRNSTKINTSEYRMRHKQGHYIWVEVSTRFLDDPSLLAVSVVRDATERRLAQQQAEALQLEQSRTTVLTQFITDSSHEFRTPLTSIKLSCYMLANDVNPKKLADRLASIMQQVDKLVQLVRDLAKLARLESLDALPLTPIQINSLLKSIAARLQGELEGRATVTFDYDPLIIPFAGNAEEICDAVEELVVNAQRHNPSPVAIEVRTQLLTDAIMIQVSDTGLGIEPSKIGHIFERFYRVDSAHSTYGFGLGLPIVQRILTLHGGRIEVSSAVGKGTIFSLYFPRSQPL